LFVGESPAGQPVPGDVATEGTSGPFPAGAALWNNLSGDNGATYQVREFLDGEVIGL